MATIGDYTLTTEWTPSANGKYAFCRKGRSEYFIKEMSSPIYPNEAILPKDSCARMKAKCEEWLKEHKGVVSRIQKASKECKYVVAPTEILVANRHIYVVSPKVSGKMIGVEEIAGHGIEDKKLLMRRFAEALVALQKVSVVHGDLKHTNVFVLDTCSGMEPRIIDFDDSYVERRPPLPSAIIGSPEYYSPELGAYIVSEDSGMAETITCKSDVFAAGIMFHEYLTGKRPTTGRYKYPFQVKRDDEVVPKVRSSWQRNLIKAMMKRDYTERFDSSKVLEMLCGSGGRSETDPTPVHGPEPTKGTGSAVVDIVHTPDGKYYAIGADGSRSQLPEFAAKGMSKVKHIVIREGGC